MYSVPTDTHSMLFVYCVVCMCVWVCVFVGTCTVHGCMLHLRIRTHCVRSFPCVCIVFDVYVYILAWLSVCCVCCCVYVCAVCVSVCVMYMWLMCTKYMSHQRTWLQPNTLIHTYTHTCIAYISTVFVCIHTCCSLCVCLGECLYMECVCVIGVRRTPVCSTCTNRSHMRSTHV
jgi:hypothetical protein